MIKKAKITARYPAGVFKLRYLGYWQINERRYLWGVIPYWKTIEEIPQVEIDIATDMNYEKVVKRIKELGYDLP